MCTFFLRIGLVAVLIAGCHRRPAETMVAQPTPRTDTVVVTVPVLRFTPADSAHGSIALDSVSLALLERRVMSRLVSVMRAQADYNHGEKSAGSGLTPAKYNAPKIRHGLLGVITFSEDGAIDVSSRERITAVHGMLRELHGPVEIRALSGEGIANVDVAMARARRVYLELIALDARFAERDVVITINTTNAWPPPPTTVEIFWRGEQ